MPGKESSALRSPSQSAMQPFLLYVGVVALVAGALLAPGASGCTCFTANPLVSECSHYGAHLCKPPTATCSAAGVFAYRLVPAAAKSNSGPTPATPSKPLGARRRRIAPALSVCAHPQFCLSHSDPQN